MSDDANAPARVDEPRLPRLVGLTIHRFRHVEPGCRLSIGSHFNLVLGRNGTGKSTLLELIAAIVRGNFAKFADEEFDVEYAFEHEGARLDCRLVNERREGKREPEATFSAKVSKEERLLWVFDASEHELALPSMTGGNESLVAGSLIAFLYAGVCTSDVAAMAGVHGNAGRMTEGDGTFEQLFDLEGIGISIGPGDVVRRGMPASIPARILRQLAGGPDDIVFSRGDLESLHVFSAMTQYGSSRLTLGLAVKVRDFSYYARPVARFVTRAGTLITHEKLSHGEKRLLAFLLLLYACPSTVVADELANGMHHGWVERLIDLLEELDTQSFLSSQDPLLIDMIPISRDTFPARNAVLLCELLESGQMRWRNMSSEEADDFFKSLEVGLERVSEIMRSKGLW